MLNQRFLFLLLLGFAGATFIAPAFSSPQSERLEQLRAFQNEGHWVPPDLVRQVQQNKDVTDAVSDLVDSKNGQYELRLKGSAIAGSIVDGELLVRPGLLLQAGARIMIGRHWTDPSRLQADDSQEPDYVSVDANADSSLLFSHGYVGTKGLFGGLESLADSIVFTLESGQLVQGEAVSFRLNDLQLPSHALEAYRFGVFISRSAEAPFVQLTGKSVAIVAGGLQRITLHADSLVKPGEALKLHLRMEDQFGNLAKDQPLSVDLLINGVFRQRVEATTAVHRIEGVSFDAPGTFLVEARTGGGGLRSISNPVHVDLRDVGLIWADFNAATTKSDGARTTEELRRQRSGQYDLVIPVDHRQFELTPTVTMVDGVRVEAVQSEGGQYVNLSRAGASDIWLLGAESPFDIRWLTPDVNVLTEVTSGRSKYLWMSERVAAAGFKSGVTGSNHSHQYPDKAQPVYTAIMTNTSMDWFDALSAGRTYVSVGEKIILQGLPMTIIAGETPKFSVTAIAASSIKGMTLLKNGEPVRTEGNKVIDENKLTLGLYSPNLPQGRLLTLPRNAREWIGFLVARGAELQVIDTPLYWDVRQGANKSRLDFYTRTHGREHALDVHLVNADPDTVLELSIASGYEDAAWLPTDRLPAETNALRFMVSLDEIVQGVSRNSNNDGYVDSVSLDMAGATIDQTMTITMAMTMTLSARGIPASRVGDYYQISVELNNGGYALSAPIHAGDF